MARIPSRIGAIAPSATLAVDTKAKALKAQGRPVIGFGAKPSVVLHPVLPDRLFDKVARRIFETRSSRELEH